MPLVEPGFRVRTCLEPYTYVHGCILMQVYTYKHTLGEEEAQMSMKMHVHTYVWENVHYIAWFRARPRMRDARCESC